MRVACVGAGASGLLLAYKLQRSFDNFSLVIYDKNPKISGTWYENRYPGCACDIPAHTYTWSFEPKADWSAVYAGSDEIFAYFGAFADKYSLHKYVKLQHLVTGAKWNAAVDAWDIDVIDLTTGEAHHTQADILINASGVLNKWAWPDIAGLQDFKGTLLHTANYDRSVNLTGKRVGLIGNGSSGIQVLPTIQPQVAKLTTFVRRATWIAPTRGFEQHFYSPEELKTFATDPAAHLAYRKQQEVAINSIFPMFLADSEVQSATFGMMTQRMQEKLQGRAEALAPSLIPTFGVGCRRITPGVGYLEALGKENVEVVYGEIERVTERGCISSTDGREHEMDVLICATGFDTSYMPAFAIIGEEGRSMKQEWVQEAKSYLGLAVAGFPNYFVISGPNSPIGNGPVLCFIEAQFDYILKLATRWQTENIRSFSPKREAVEDFIAYKDQFMKTTVWEHSCRSWYKSNSVTGKVTALWPGSTLHYLEAIAEPRYEDWVISYKGNRFSWLGNGFSQTESDPTADWSYYIRYHDDSPFTGRKKALQVLNKAGTIDRSTSMDTISI
ncbi:FAD/NAD(P)-binding domain-containing protein [Collybia nuda]|uniref:FAD/NAD(P)-binding domain-containing protein n=1 Tax=Collybia nuda TaxID=64659 RepID=A0A9P5YIT3_9AGAR|nr:FAD/NAD(P)-binding domain-containing protein [Collybia nuda]